MKNSVNEIAQRLIKSGKQTIGYNNELHKILSNISDYEFSLVNNILEKEGMKVEWLVIEDVFEVC